MAKHNTVGAWGEQAATEHLITQGYAIRERNWRMGHYEIDIVAMHHNRLIFVEVKTRTDTETNPADAVDRRRMMRMVTAANAYIHQQNLYHEVQYDIIAITGTPQDYKLEHIPDAFLAPLRTYR